MTMATWTDDEGVTHEVLGIAGRLPGTKCSKRIAIEVYDSRQVSCMACIAHVEQPYRPTVPASARPNMQQIPRKR